MVTFQTISRSTRRRSFRVCENGRWLTRYAQHLAFEHLMGRKPRATETVLWLSETQPVICDRSYVSLIRLRQQQARPDGARPQYPSLRHKRLHVIAAEAALGKPLPPGAEVHHVDGNKWNNANNNLVICQDHAYHYLLHARARVQAMGGDPNTQRKCADCKQLTDKASFSKDGNQCRPCRLARCKRNHQRRRAALAALKAAC